MSTYQTLNYKNKQLKYIHAKTGKKHKKTVEFYNNEDDPKK